MSLITTVEATPGRVLGSFRYLVAYGPLKLENLAGQLWPVTTRSERANFDRALRLEMIESGLVEETEEGLNLSSGLPEIIKKGPDTAEKYLPAVITDLVMSGPERNRDLAYALAWYLSLDPRNAPGDDMGALNQAEEDGVKDLINVTSDATYGQFEDWVKYLGFGWLLPASTDGSRVRLVPDPTQYLRRILPEILPDVGRPMAIADFRNQLAERAPVFEGGYLRDDIDSRTGRPLNTGEIAPTTALALLRLVDEGVIELTAPSDAGVHILPFGESSRVSYITLNTPE